VAAALGQAPAAARRILEGAGLLVAGAIGLELVDGVLFWPMLCAAGVGALRLAGALVAPRGDQTFAAVSLSVASVCLLLTLCEAALLLLERSAARPLPEVAAGPLPPPPELPAALREKIARMQSAFVMPREWEHRDLERTPGVRQPYSWQGVLHVFDENRMRRDRPFPPRDPSRFRIAVVGDSFTYGEGIDARWTYAAGLERALSSEFDVEVLNLGVAGNSSADTLEVVRRALPGLVPDLVVYGVCLNDFLDPGQREPERHLVPLPRAWKKALQRRTRVGRLLHERTDALLRRLGLRADFHGELLADFDAYRARFERDVREMNELVVASGRPPIVALVLDHAPKARGPGRELAAAAEQALRRAGIELVESDDYYRAFDGRDFRVSRWEGHPNEEAHAIWAGRLAARLRGRPDLARFRRAAG
jgi:lysophospholipase L1-like esterase